jgi:anaerobic magnesium-protoporphyrin IX monomethyl ester cyclase
LANGILSSAEILRFRDDAFQTYFRHQPYLDMVRTKFGQKVVDHVTRMREVPLKRKLFEMEAA